MTYVQTPRVKIVITTGRDQGSASWINNKSYFDFALGVFGLLGVLALVVLVVALAFFTGGSGVTGVSAGSSAVLFPLLFVGKACLSSFISTLNNYKTFYEFMMTHQAKANRFSLFSLMAFAIAVARFLVFVTDVRTGRSINDYFFNKRVVKDLMGGKAQF